MTDSEYPVMACPNCGYWWLVFYLPGEDYDMKNPKLTKFQQNAVVRLREERWLCTVCGREWEDTRIYEFGDSKIVKMKDVGGPDWDKIREMSKEVEEEFIETKVEKLRKKLESANKEEVIEAMKEIGQLYREKVTE